MHELVLIENNVLIYDEEGQFLDFDLKNVQYGLDTLVKKVKYNEPIDAPLSFIFEHLFCYYDDLKVTREFEECARLVLTTLDCID